MNFTIFKLEHHKQSNITYGLLVQILPSPLLCISVNYGCTPNQWPCPDNGKCIPIDSVCDNQPDCDNSGDEGATCSKYYNYHLRSLYTSIYYTQFKSSHSTACFELQCSTGDLY